MMNMMNGFITMLRVAEGDGFDISSIISLLEKALVTVRNFGTPLAALAFGVCGILMVWSSDPQSVAKAKQWMIRIAVGLAIVWLAEPIANAIVSSMPS